MKKNCLIFLLPLILTYLIADTITVSGKIIDATNNPISGVNIFVDEVGTFSDQDGYFTISMSTGDRLQFKHIGYKSIKKFHIKWFVTIIPFN